MTTDVSGNLLLVEGVDDKHVVQHLGHKLAPNLKFDCVDRGGIDSLLKTIRLEVKSLDRHALGILADANDDVAHRWQAIDNMLREGTELLDERVGLPKAPIVGGTIISGPPRVGVWLMPDNEHSGELENFVAQLLPEGDPVWPLAEQFIEGIPHGHREFPRQKELRAKLYAWLATRRRPGPMGTAIRAGSLDATAPIAIRFADWLKALFGP